MAGAQQGDGRSTRNQAIQPATASDASVAAKYGLVENLWEHFGQDSKKGAADTDLMPILIWSFMRWAITSRVPWRLQDFPTIFEKRFSWLSAGDVRVKQELLNYFRHKEKALAVERARAKVPVMLEHLRSEGGRHTRRLAEVLKIGQHEFEITLDRSWSGVTLWSRPSSGVEAQRRRWAVFGGSGG